MTANDRMDQILDEGNRTIKNYVVFVLDRSSSMREITLEAIDAFNQQIKETKKLTKEGNVIVEASLVTFSTEVDKPEIWCRPLSEVFELKENNYQPSGWTAMYDAVGYAITELQKQPDINDPNTAVLMIIISDGQENYSTHFNSSDISRMVKELQDTKRWTFVYEGANQDLAQVRADTGFSKGNTQSFRADTGGMRISTQSRGTASQVYYRNLHTASVVPDSGLAAADMSSTCFYGPEEEIPEDREEDPDYKK